ncbi:MAG TPA: SDR family NAD(P)-dependent oxidoreductase [Acidimicrobiales bacterium]|nr:SDR family NAD(P)-dependent oxidoreductase [Acidimicrobiales bacterium]
MELKNKVAVVTGASSGLGRRFALDLCRAGAIVTGLARRADLLESLGAEMRRHSVRSSTIVCDVSDTESFTRTLEKIESEQGRIDVLVNNAGIGEPRGEAEGLAPYRAVMETNYFAPVAGTLAVLPGMRRRGEGVIVNVSSDSGRAPTPREAAYGASKAALSAFTESLAFDVEASGVHMHVLYPGWVPTAMGSGAVEAGMPTPPRMVRRTEEQVSRLLLEGMGGRRIDLDATAVARLAPVARSLFPGAYRRGVRRASG